MYNNSTNSKNYYSVLQGLTENCVNFIFNSMHFDSKRNNLKDIKAVDLIVNGKKVDVQFSQNFGNYGDIRIDVISAGYYGDNWELNQNDFLSKLEFIHKIRISKVGKYFLDGFCQRICGLNNVLRCQVVNDQRGWIGACSPTRHHPRIPR